jgi:hypothetical protein
MFNIKNRFLIVIIGLLLLLPWLVSTSHPAYASNIAEIEPNDTQATAQGLANLGHTFPVEAAINAPGDVDWYHFEAVADQTYVVELFNVSAGLANDGWECGSHAHGVGIKIYDQAGTLVSYDCTAYGPGNTHNLLAFTPGMSASYSILIQPNSALDAGNYYLRILPKHDEPGADWDPTTHEPNNSHPNAYAIGLGYENALTSEIEPRDPIYSTFTVDRDWYQFEAVADQTYVVELFNVSAGLANDGWECGSHAYGVGIEIFDQVGNSIASDCNRYGAGNMHNDLDFTAGVSATYYILVQPNSKLDAGSYSLRLLPKHGEPGANWDPTTYEPNNNRRNAHEIGLGYQNALTSEIELRDPIYSTYTVDHDWYRFETVAGHTYVVELFNVSAGLANDGWECGSHAYGVGIKIYDQAGSEINFRCNAYGSGNVHNYIDFIAGLSNTYYILVQPNSKLDTGTYSLRVLPKYDEPGAAWDPVTHEPNNIIWNALLIQTGRENAIRSQIEVRTPTFSTNNVDHDDFRFEAIAGQKYVVEVLGVDIGLTGQGAECGSWNSGVGIRLYNSTGDEVAYDCRGDNDGILHNTLSFVASLNGPYYIRLQPNSKTAQGHYTLCISDSTCVVNNFLPTVIR